jgi:acetyltransferase-like isoleucine patch superfamily enzyme
MTRIKRNFQLFVQVLGTLLPRGAKRSLFQHLLGWSIGEDVRIGYSIICSQTVHIGSHVRIGHGNVFWDLKSVHVGSGTVLLNLNHFVGGTGGPDAFTIGECAKITSRHFFDCTGGIQIGDRALIGGRDSHLWTHYFDAKRDRIHFCGLVIGERTYICARATLVYCQVPPGCVVAAGAVVTGDFRSEGPDLLLAGNPAIVKRKPAAEPEASPASPSAILANRKQDKETVPELGNQ